MAKILYVNSTAMHGGAEEALLDIMTAAAELGHRPFLVTPHEGWLTGGARSAGIDTAIVASLPDAMTTDSWAAQFGPWLPSAFGIAAIARKHKVDIVESNTPRTAYHGGLGGRLAGARTITHCYDIVGIPYQSRAKGALLDALTDWTVTVSNAATDAILAQAPRLSRRISTLHCAFRPSLHAGLVPADLHALFGLPSGAFVIGSASAMTPWKGQDVLIDAFRIISSEVPNARLVLVGGSQGSLRQNSFEAMLRARVREYGLDDRVTFAGWREDWCSLLASFDIFVHAPTRPDPLPIVLIRGCALGRAVIATPVGGIPEIVGDDGASGVLVPPADAAALADALRSLINDPGRRKRLGESARERIPVHFSWDKLKTTLAGIYGKVLER